MQYRFIHCILTFAAVMMFSSVSQAQPFVFDLIADPATVAPGQSPELYTGFHAPSLAGNQVSFDGFYTGSFLHTAALKDGANPIAGVYDASTVLPGQGPLTINTISSPGDLNAGGTVVYKATSSTFIGGIYTGTPGGGLVTIADNLTAKPGGGEFSPFTFGLPSIDANGDVAFIDSQPIYLWNGATFSEVAGPGDPIAGKSPETISLFPNATPISLRNGDIVAKGNNSAGGKGIYRISGGVITPLADQDTSVPGGTGTFTDVTWPSFDGTNVAFVGTDSNSDKGIYLAIGGAIVTVADKNTTVPGTASTFDDLKAVTIDGDQIVFRGESGGIQGFYLYKISDMSLVKIIDESEMLDGQNIADGFGINLQHNGLSGGRFGFDARFDGGAQSVYVTDLGSPPVADADTVKVTVGMALVAPGDTVRVPVLINNETGPPVGGLQMSILLQDITGATFIGVEDTMDIPGFDVLTNEIIPGTLNFALFSASNAVIPTGVAPVRIATLVYVVDDNAALGSTNELDIQGLLIGDEFGDPIPGKICIGAINVGIKGDLNHDGTVNILDVIRLSRILVGNDPPPAEGTTAFKIADASSDGTLNVVDIIYMINQILGIPNTPPGKLLAQGTVILGLADATVLPDGRMVIPLSLAGNQTIGGLEVTLTYDSSQLRVETPVLANGLSGIQLVSHIADGVVRIVAFRTGADVVLPSDGQAVALIPVSAVNGSGTSTLTLSDAAAATVQAQLTPVQLGNTVVTVPSGKSSAPASFALTGNAPNPFNPSTTISYEAPQQAHIQLIVYNLLGQEIVRLIDGVQSAGRHTVVWDARNAQGIAVSSGVYLYRLTSDTGYTDTRRMTLVK